MDLSKNNSGTYKFILTKHFKNQLKSYLKKDVKLKQRLIEELSSKELKTYIAIKGYLLKTRLSSSSSGKARAYRLYIYALHMNRILVPICIFSKSEKSDVSEKELTGHLKATKIELGLS